MVGASAIRHNRGAKGKRVNMQYTAKLVAAMAVLTAAASTQFVVSAAGMGSAAGPASTSIVAGGMATHLLEGQTAAAQAQPTAPSLHAAASKIDASAVISALSANGSSNPDLVSQAVSEAGGFASTMNSSTVSSSTDASDSGSSSTASPQSQQATTTAGPSSSASSSAEVRAATSAAPSSASQSASDVQSSSASASASPSDTASWHYAAGAFGCAQGNATGTAYLCHASGAPQPDNQRRDTADVQSEASATERASAEAEEMFENLFDKRQSADDKSGNGGPPDDVLNKDSPDVGWLDTVVGAVPYKNGDLAASIVWILATLLLFPLFLIRLFRRSSLIAHVLLTVFLWGCVMLAAFGIRAYLSNGTPKTTLMNVENILLQMLPCFLIEPLINLLSLYAQQGGFPTGVPKVALLLRFFNLVAFLLYIIGGAYLANWLSKWDSALMDNQTIRDRDDFPDGQPLGITRIGPIVGAFLQVICIIGSLLLIPIARGENGSMRPGGFIAILVALITIPVVFRVLQTLHAQGELSDEMGSNENPFTVLAEKTNTMTSAAMSAVMSLTPVSQVAPPGMYSPDSDGIDWSQLQQTLASRGRIQSPLVFNLVYIFPQWLMTFFFFFVHAPGNQNSNKLAAASAQP